MVMVVVYINGFSWRPASGAFRRPTCFAQARRTQPPLHDTVPHPTMLYVTPMTRMGGVQIPHDPHGWCTYPHRDIRIQLPQDTTIIEHTMYPMYCVVSS